MTRNRAAKILMTMAAAVILASPIMAANTERDPEEIGRRHVSGHLNLYTVREEIGLGRQLALEVDRESRFISDPAVNEYVNRLGQKLAANSDVRFPVTIKVIDSDEVTAFTLPGGHIYIAAGFIRLTSNEAELASALAHEIGHVAARHATREASRMRLLNVGALPLMAFGGWGGIAAGGLARLVMPLAFLRFSRGFESEADLLGLQYLWKAGYDPEANIDLFETLESTEHRRPGAIKGLFHEHPLTRDRVARTQNNIDRILPPRREYILNTAEYEEIRSILAEPGGAAQDDLALRNREE